MTVSLKKKVEKHVGNSDHSVLSWNIIYTLKLKKDKKVCRLYHKENDVGIRKWFGK
jgi:hypothetical protein